MHTDNSGPFDLSKFMQVEFGGKEHEAAIAKILAAAKAAGKIAAIFCESTSFSCIDGQN
jgi:4-hydroxy-2-oxoheptanedioate aldolase